MGQHSSPGELVPRLSLGAWLCVVSQPLWVPTLLRGVETALGSMSCWLIKTFPPLVESWKLEHCLQREMRKNEKTEHSDQLTDQCLAFPRAGGRHLYVWHSRTETLYCVKRD